jgi:hypothetical protein
VPTILTSDAKKAVHEDTATKVGLELVKHEGRQFAAARVQICQEPRPILVANEARQSIPARARTTVRFGLLANAPGLGDVAASG